MMMCIKLLQKLTMSPISTIAAAGTNPWKKSHTYLRKSVIPPVAGWSSELFSWLGKRRSIRVRWCKKDENWLALIKFACAHILFAMAFYG